jgi:hypothetical protein
VADMNIALTYHHLRDDWQDEKSIFGLAGAGIIRKKYRKILKNYPRQCKGIVDALERLQECEKNDSEDIDLVARCFGELMSELFIYRKDTWEKSLRKIGFYLGKFIYILDAYDDIGKDIRHNSYNPLKSVCDKESFDENIERMLVRMMADCSSEFEKLPCLVDVTILRNILYEGVWTKFTKIQEDRRKRKEQKK